MSDIQDHTEYLLKKHEKLTTNYADNVCINRSNNRLVFKIRDGYRLELQTPETIKLLGRTKKQYAKQKMEKILEVVEVVLLQSNLADNQYQQKSEVLYSKQILCIFVKFWTK